MARPDVNITQYDIGEGSRSSTEWIDGKRPKVAGVTGTVSNGQSITISGYFSSKRNGDWYQGIYQPAQAGSYPIPSYGVTVADSFLGTGACIVANTVIGQNWTLQSNPIISLGSHDECYYSYMRKTIMNVWGDNSPIPQIKLERPLVKSGGHAGAQATIIFFGTAAGVYDGTGQTQCNWEANAPTSAYGEPSNAALGAHFNAWIRTWGYHKKNTDGVSNGGIFKCMKNESTKTSYFNFVGGGKNQNDTRTGSSSLTPFFNPRYVAETTSETYDGIGQEFWLPFFKQASTQLDMYVDGLIINDSPESVWLINGTNVDTAMATGKAVHIPQSSRSGSTITATVWLGDLLTSDNIYVTVFNSNGTYSTPVLVRAAA